MFKRTFRFYFATPMIVRILVAFALGILLGLICSSRSVAATGIVEPLIQIIAPFGKALVSLLKMIVFPMMFFSLIVGTSALSIKKSGKLGASVVGWYFVTSVFATVFGMAMAMALNPKMENPASVAEHFQSDVTSLNSASNASDGGNLGEFFVGLFMNPFEALANGQFLPIVVFSILVGLAVRFVLDSVKSSDEEKKSVNLLVSVCQGCQTVSFKIIDWVLEYFPIGIFALAFTNFAKMGTDIVEPYVRIIACVACSTLCMIFFVYPLALLFLCKENPYKILNKIRLPILTAFTTRSSAATLSVSMNTAKQIGVDSSLSSFSLPLGCTVNMDGVCVHLPVFVILASNIFNVPMTPTLLLTLLVSVVFASIGAGGVPGGSVFLLLMILENAQFSPDQVAMIVGLALGVNPILDMFETACNVAGDNVCTYIVAKRNGMIKSTSANDRV